MGCATALVKTIVFVFNFLCAVVGIALIAVGGIILAGLRTLQSDEVDLKTFQIAPGLILGVGIIVFIISFLGCCGACKNNECMLTTYAVILLILFVAQLAVGIYGYVQVKDDKDVKHEIKGSLENLLKNYNKNGTATESMDLFQVELQCCGVENKADYGNDIPWSCCVKVDTEKKQCESGSELKYWKVGCAEALTKSIQKAVQTIGYVAMGICVIEIVGASFAFCLSKRR